MNEHQWVANGRNDAVSRVDGPLKVTGAAPYPADIARQDLVHAYLITSTVARGAVTKLDLEASRASPGVISILTADDFTGELDDPKFGASSTSVSPMKVDYIWHDAQILAIVIATSFEAAEEAAMQARITYHTEPVATSFGDPETETVAAAEAKEGFSGDIAVGDFEAAFAGAERCIDQTYSTPAQHHNPIELFSTTAEWHGDQLTVYEPTQNVTGWRHELARELKMAPEKVRVVSPYIGGAFGSKGPITPRTAIIAAAARKIGRPLRCVVPRGLAFAMHTYRAETKHRIRMGADAQGHITAFAHEGWELTSRPDAYAVGGTSTTARMYDYGSILTKVFLVRADRPTPSFMRSPPETPYVFALEAAMDEMAEACGLDPVEFRRRNDTSREPVEGKPFSSRSLMECYDRAADAFGWPRDRGRPGSRSDGDWLVGYGCATAIYPTNVAPSLARIKLSSDGTATVSVATHEIGTGIRTVCAQLVAEAFGLEPDRVEVRAGDSALPPAPVAGGSNTTASVSSALLAACEDIRRELVVLASKDVAHLSSGLQSSEMALKDGRLIAGNVAIPVLELMQRAGCDVIEKEGAYAPDAATKEAIANLRKGKLEMISGEKGDTVKYAFGAEMVEVRIHKRTREIRVPRIVGAFAAGRVINPMTARSQLMGGMIWGISCGLMEATEYDRATARVVNRDLQDYLIPVNADIANVEVLFVDEVDHDVNPAGVKGLGELGNVGTPAAISSAIYHATGKRIRELPIRIDSLFNA